jgi:flagellar biogenesis protein FliO
MNKQLVLFLLCLPSVARAVELQAIKTAGEANAEVSFIADGALPSMPRLAVEENRVELHFSGVKLSPSLLSQVEVPSPHALIQRLSAYPVDGGGARVRLVVNGSTEKLRDRVKLLKTESGVALSLTYPAGSEATLKLLQEEQAVLDSKKAPVEEARGGFGWFRLLVALVLFGAAGAGSYYFVKFARKRVGLTGSRKHLIETIAGAPIGDGKASVAILRVGGEFVLVGITSSQVNMLSHLPKLQAQYEEESSLERDTFKEAIEQQARHHRSGISV